MHVLLFRKWENRVKGRDWYDLEWYIRKGVPSDISHFLRRVKDTGDWKEKKITQDQIIDLLKEKIESVSFDGIKEDVARFIKDDSALKIWSPAYFNNLSEKLKVI